jgi:hypothetical protein
MVPPEKKKYQIIGIVGVFGAALLAMVLVGAAHAGMPLLGPYVTIVITWGLLAIGVAGMVAIQDDWKSWLWGAVIAMVIALALMLWRMPPLLRG